MACSIALVRVLTSTPLRRTQDVGSAKATLANIDTDSQTTTVTSYFYEVKSKNNVDKTIG